MINRDKLFVYISSGLLFVMLLLTLFFPNFFTKLVLSLIFIPITILTLIFIKKRNVLSVHKKQVLLIISLISILYLGIFYISGAYFGFVNATVRFSFPVVYRFLIPLTIIIVGIELLRNVYLAQKGVVHKIIFFITCIMLDIAIYSNVKIINTFNGWMDIFGNVVIGSIAFNLLFNYLTKRYGYYPNIIFRLLVTLYPYIIPVVPNAPDILVVFCKMLVPFLIYLFINAMYGRRDKVVSYKKNRLSAIITVVMLIVVTSSVMIVSNRFGIGMLVIGSESMSGVINKGDVIFYKTENDYFDIELQDIIVFKNGETRIVHRVIDKYIVNGESRYITKGDANESQDTGYVTQSQIVGIVTDIKLSGVGWLTIMLRDAFK